MPDLNLSISCMHFMTSANRARMQCVQASGAGLQPKRVMRALDAIMFADFDHLLKACLLFRMKSCLKAH